jgi:hypothetical protein
VQLDFYGPTYTLGGKTPAAPAGPPGILSCTPTCKRSAEAIAAQETAGRRTFMAWLLKKRSFSGGAAVLFLALILSTCTSTGPSSDSRQGFLVGRIVLRLENYGQQSGTYTDGILATLKQKDSGATSNKALDHEGYFAFAGLAEGRYVLTGLFVDDRVVTRWRSFTVPLGIELTVEPDQVNVVGEIVLTYDKLGKGKIEVNQRVEDMKAAYSTRSPSSPMLQKHWRSALSGT